MWSLRFEFLTSPPTNPLYRSLAPRAGVDAASPGGPGEGTGGAPRTHFHHLSAVGRVEVEGFDCTLPISVYATPMAGAGSSASGIMRHPAAGLGETSPTTGTTESMGDFEPVHGFRRMSFALS